VALCALRLDDLLAAALCSHVLGADGLHPAAARSVYHVGDGTSDFEVGDFHIAAMRGHLADALERVLRQAGEALRRALFPRRLVADFRGALRASSVARRADHFDHFLATALAALGVHLLRRDRRRENKQSGQYQPLLSVAKG
jgi:hypothetical protein